ncbi:ABC transporter permease [Streptomyces kronopolitis]|uniref:ABC transporter permease n=1 Tax=Streptomyces kronopolitis TaxID=1612435 RepID=UPI0034135919
MSTPAEHLTGTGPAKDPVRTGSAGRLLSLGRAEWTLLARNKSALSTSLALPVAMAFAMKGAAGHVGPAGSGLSPETLLLPAALGYVLLFAVYSTLTGAYVARREELVLKRLRTGEPADREILAGTALPFVVLGLVQCAVLVVLGDVVLHAGPPRAPLSLVAGVLLGTVLVVALAAACSSLAGSTEAAQLVVLPLMLLSMAGSGIVAPLEAFPGRVATVLELLPLSPVMELIRAGWTGGADAGRTLSHLAVAAVWIALALVAVRRWFRWEPRR